MDGDARVISVYDLSVLVSAKLWNRACCSVFDLSGYIASSSKKCSEQEGCACCKDQPML
jgi:hypothetical protein